MDFVKMMFYPLCAASPICLLCALCVCACLVNRSAAAFVSSSGTKQGLQSLCRAGGMGAMACLVVPRTLFRVRSSREQGEGRQPGEHLGRQAGISKSMAQPSNSFSPRCLFLFIGEHNPKIIKSSRFTVIVGKISTHQSFASLSR